MVLVGSWSSKIDWLKFENHSCPVTPTKVTHRIDTLIKVPFISLFYLNCSDASVESEFRQSKGCVKCVEIYVLWQFLFVKIIRKKCNDSQASAPTSSKSSRYNQNGTGWFKGEYHRWGNSLLSESQDGHPRPTIPAPSVYFCLEVMV